MLSEMTKAKLEPNVIFLREKGKQWPQPVEGFPERGAGVGAFPRAKLRLE